MKHLILIIIILLLSLLSSCYEPIPGSGNVIKYQENFGTINSITLKTIGNVYVTAGFPQKVEIEVDDNFVSKIETKLETKNLVIKAQGRIAPTQFNVYITISDISELKNTGSGKIIVQNKFTQGSTLFLTVTGSGRIEIPDFTANECLPENTGSGHIIAIAGIVDKGDYTVRGSGSIDFSNVINREVIAKNYGSGKILFNVTEKLNATITGSGDIEYWGDPADIQQIITGTGRLIKRN